MGVTMGMMMVLVGPEVVDLSLGVGLGVRTTPRSVLGFSADSTILLPSFGRFRELIRVPFGVHDPTSETPSLSTARTPPNFLYSSRNADFISLSEFRTFLRMTTASSLSFPI